MKICWIGLGNLGMPCAETLAKHGHDVAGYDVESKQSSFIKIKASMQEAIKDAEIVFVAVPTPHSPGYDGSVPTSELVKKNFDTSIVANVLQEANQHIRQDQTFVLVSTVLPGTVRKEFAPLLTNGTLVYNPYFIAMGSVAWDFMNPEMIIIGTEDQKTPSALIELYKSVIKNSAPIHNVTWEEAECIKIFYNCYSNDTEVLTNNGWKLFANATDADNVLALNPETMVPEWVKPDKWVSRDWNGEMIHFHSSKDDVLVTPNHNMFIGKQTSYRKPIDGKTWGYSWGLMPAAEIIDRSEFVFQQSTEWHNNSPATVTLAGVDIPTDIYVQFMAWYLSEGCSGSGRVTISQDREVNAEKYEMIFDVFSSVYAQYPGKNKLCEAADGISLLWKDLADELSIYGKSFDKFVPENIKSLGKDMIRLFLDVYNLANGSAMHTSRYNGEGLTTDRAYKYYATSSDKMAADLGELIIKVGHFPSYQTTQSPISNKPCNLVYELIGKTSNYQRSSTIGLKFNKIDYSGKVYCAVLPKYHVFLTRRNGKCTWQGNTWISTKISLVNMMQDVAVKLGNVNVDTVTDALKQSTQRIVSPQYMTAGMGDGGACHPRDNIALGYFADKIGLGYDLFHAIMRAREIQAKNLADFLIEQSKFGKYPIVIHGKSYKPGVHYTEGSYSLLIEYYCKQAGYSVSFVDPLTEDNLTLDYPAVFLLAHSASVTYDYTKTKQTDQLYCDIPSGSVVVDPWRRFDKSRTDIEVIYYGDTNNA